MFKTKGLFALVILTGCARQPATVTQAELDAAFKECPALEIMLIADKNTFATYTPERLKATLVLCKEQMGFR